jgi:hypothetical protein
MLKILSIIVLVLLYGQNVYADIFGTKDIIKFTECYPIPEYNSYKKFKNSEDSDSELRSWEINLKKDIVTRTIIWSDKQIAIFKKNNLDTKKIDIDSFPILSSTTNFIVTADKNYEFTFNIRTGHIQIISKNTSNTYRGGSRCKIS